MKSNGDMPLILIVDDTAANIQVLAECLRGAYRIKFATSGQAALDLLAEAGPPDLILLDVMMPNMDGYEVCRRIKMQSELNRVPIIFVTAMNEVSDETLGFGLGAADYISKPFHSAIVKARVHNHIQIQMMSRRLESLAWIDGLTGIPNRRRFDEVLELEWKRACRTGLPLSAVLVDVDRFKDFNDHYGHVSGDNCLRQIATALAETVIRGGDLVARYGGEEFVVLLPQTDIEGARKIAEQLCMAVKNLRISHRETVRGGCVTISCGYSTVIAKGDESSAALLVEADAMLYRAKKAGRNRACGPGDEVCPQA